MRIIILKVSFFFFISKQFLMRYCFFIRFLSIKIKKIDTDNVQISRLHFTHTIHYFKFLMNLSLLQNFFLNNFVSFEKIVVLNKIGFTYMRLHKCIFEARNFEVKFTF